MADEFKFPMGLRSAMERVATVLTNTADVRRRELDEDSQILVRSVLDELDSACIEANLAVPTRMARRARRDAGAPLRIRVGHSAGYDCQAQLYDVVRGVALPPGVTLSLPHENGAAADCAKTFFAEGCDVFIAEVSTASTGLGMEIAHADMHNVPVACLHREGTERPAAIEKVTPLFMRYESPEQLARHIESVIHTVISLRADR